MKYSMGRSKLTNHCMPELSEERMYPCCIDSGNFRLCWCKVESSCYQLQLGIHLRLENSWYEIQYGEVKLTNHCMLNCLRKECIHCCIDSKTSVMLMQVENSCYQLQLGIHLRLENSWYEIQYGEVKLTNHCMFCLRKECIRCCMTMETSVNVDAKLRAVVIVAIRHSFTSGK